MADDKVTTVSSWQHVNDEVRIKGMTGPQLGLGILLIIVGFIMSVIVGLLFTGIAIGGWKYLMMEQKKTGDVDPFSYLRVKNASPNLIQDQTSFYERLVNHESE